MCIQLINFKKLKTLSKPVVNTSKYLEPLFWPKLKNTPFVTPQLHSNWTSELKILNFRFNTDVPTTFSSIQHNKSFNRYFIRESALVNFFGVHNIDIPVYLKPVKDRLNILHGEDERRLTNLLMLNGKKNSNLKVLTAAFFRGVTFLGITQQNYYTETVAAYLSLLNLVQNYNNLVAPKQETLSLSSLIASDKTKTKEVLLRSDLWNNLLEFNVFTAIFNTLFANNLPSFTFYMQKTDKSILKYSRGKSSKYSLIWKYVPQYKRKRVVSHWLKKEIKLQKSLNYQNRVEKAVELLLLNPKASLTSRLRRFVHKFVFHKYKKKLLKTLNVKN